jgi:glycyl-tRNA synthetase beta chain
MSASLLVELRTEELPPKSLRQLAQAFADGVAGGLARHDLRTPGAGAVDVYATPRRLAVLVPGVLAETAPREVEVTGPSLKIGLDANGAPTPALQGFARKNNVSVDALARRDTPKGVVFVARLTVAGNTLAGLLAGIVDEALKKLPIPKVMRWGDGDAEFVRPVHGLVMLHDAHVVPGIVLGVESGRTTRGHRFLSKGDIAVASAQDYARQLRDRGRVIASFDERRAAIETLLRAEADRQNAELGDYEDLLEEVTALVEYPAVYVGHFDAAYLDVPAECLVLTMRQNQKYFPLFGADGVLLPRFLIVSNMLVDNPSHIVNGNERVVRPRLEDARFFYVQDRRQRLEDRVPQLAKVVYHNKLGTQLERVERIERLAGHIARSLGAELLLAERAARLAKADLLTGMVGEFPELQGIMGRYYAVHDGEPHVVAAAIEGHYRPRYAGDALPEGEIACAVALADKLDTLAGLFGIGQVPSGERDPFGLRRAALGVLRILAERELPLLLHDLVNQAFATYQGKVGDAHTDLEMFIYERFAGYLRERGHTAREVDAVLCMRPARIDLVPKQLEAVRAFGALPEAESLAAANKRVANILKQAEAKGESYGDADAARLREPAERSLFEALRAAAGTAGTAFERGDYTGYLKTFAVLKEPVDRFFDSVMVMVDDAQLRHNRLALLRDLREAMNRVADISRLAA